jgi:hypothetical protein
MFMIYTTSQVTIQEVVVGRDTCHSLCFLSGREDSSVAGTNELSSIRFAALILVIFSKGMSLQDLEAEHHPALNVFGNVAMSHP